MPHTRPARVRAVLVAQPETVVIGTRPTVTGIRKRVQAGRVAVTAAGLDGDHVLNVKHHGGPDQAVYVYTQPDLDAWTEALGEEPEPGAFGENLRLDTLESAALRVGDRLDITAADGTPGPLLEVTAPRIPCATLAANMGDPEFVKRFARMRRPGAYLRVLRDGHVGAGDTVTLHPAPDDAPTIHALFELWYDRSPSREFLAALLAHPLAVRLRRDVEERLSTLG
ncbi:MOSC domain-containing protein YiiM [Deinococcus metalli]|uniref:MOSC domain-containing protein YiiM n=1 Tax=Deinococcus metalli TaxID=1141878 RepID=A0A7W8NQI8_9DEIO|nr:MOSC domain-containing protein [Deinococcus metalli]MBB5375172.1 MOSC domain-containing protein YiiM [Deinococcus metalli]GHF31198.1 molybdenum cofactor biosysynthesis protein [Deinococcus metalli]